MNTNVYLTLQVFNENGSTQHFSKNKCFYCKKRIEVGGPLHLIVQTEIASSSSNAVVSEDVLVLNALTTDNGTIKNFKLGKGTVLSKVCFLKSLDEKYPKCKENIFFSTHSQVAT